MALKIISRTLLVISISIVGLFFFPVQVHDFLVNNLNYKVPSGFFGFTFDDWGIVWSISSTFLMGVIFGTLGKKIDYIFIITIFILMSLNNFFTANMAWLVYSGFVGATIIGNLIGFVLKLIRLKLWPQWR